jgi:endonuclease/exonuclease/phosphatase family metal-dependent hydrolase
MVDLRLLSLNAWGGRVYEPLFALLRELARDGIHALCLQEIYDAPEALQTHATHPNVRLDLLSRLREMLPNYQVFFAANTFDPRAVPSGNALLVHDGVRVEDYRVHPIARRQYPMVESASGFATYVHTLQVADLRIGGRTISVGNFHGLPLPGDKLDTPARLAQSKRLLEVAGDVDVLCGDFNLDPNTTSISMLEDHWRNLIREFQVPTTRSRLNPFWGTPQEQRYADYTFVSSSLTADRFQALDAQVSDHLGLFLEAHYETTPTDCSTAPSDCSAARWASVTPDSPVMSRRS